MRVGTGVFGGCLPSSLVRPLSDEFCIDEPSCFELTVLLGLCARDQRGLPNCNLKNAMYRYPRNLSQYISPGFLFVTGTRAGTQYVDKHEEEKNGKESVCRTSPSGLIQDYDRQTGLLLISTPLAPDYRIPFRLRYR